MWRTSWPRAIRRPIELVNRALRIGQEIQRLRAAEAETSADVRAYFITAQESFVSRTRSSLAAFDSAGQQLLSLTADSPSQQQRLAQIVSIEHAREERMFGDIARFRSGELPGDQLRVALRKVEAGTAADGGRAGVDGAGQRTASSQLRSAVRKRCAPSRKLSLRFACSSGFWAARR